MLLPIATTEEARGRRRVGMGVAIVWSVSMKIEDITLEEGWVECVSCSLGQFAVGASVKFPSQKKREVEKTLQLSPGCSVVQLS